MQITYILTNNYKHTVSMCIWIYMVTWVFYWVGTNDLLDANFFVDELTR